MLGDHVLDLILLVLVVLFAISGYRQGFIVGVLSFVGFVGGVVLGMLIAPPLVKAVVSGAAQQALLAVVIAFLAATLGQLIASSVGSALRSRVTWESARSVDAVGGACVSSVALLVVAWFIGSALVTSPIVWLRIQVKNSQVLHGVDAFMPQQANTWFSSFRGFVSKTEFPQVFGGLGGEPIAEVPPPDTRILNTPALVSARKSIVKVMGTAHSCQRRIEGTGFVYAPGRVMTNAHVVAGVDSGPTVYTMGEGNYHARVVLYDDKRDIAVLDVPGLNLPSLKFDEGAQSRDDAVVAGFPKNHPFTARAARIRAKQKAKGADIYHSGQVTREIYAIRALVEQGNSGGPLLSSSGKVYGVVFAAAVDNKETGYALTAHEVAPDAEAGINASGSVSTQSCSE
ncbi:MarP family serine protease [Actinoallomurus soli]|uniref:MarP family serine protease n=1 Tax=Actinoallomurus soli TaxID=2952535 RepID=UPI00387394B5